MKLFCTADKSKQLHDPHRGPTNLCNWEVTGSNTVESLNFVFRLLFPKCINWWTHGEDRAIACFCQPYRCRCIVMTDIQSNEKQKTELYFIPDIAVRNYIIIIKGFLTSVLSFCYICTKQQVWSYNGKITRQTNSIF